MAISAPGVAPRVANDPEARDGRACSTSVEVRTAREARPSGLLVAELRGELAQEPLGAVEQPSQHLPDPLRPAVRLDGLELLAGVSLAPPVVTQPAAGLPLEKLGAQWRGRHHFGARAASLDRPRAGLARWRAAMKPPGSVLRGVVMGVALLACWRIVAATFGLATTSDRLPQWDEANYAVLGVRVEDAATERDWTRLSNEVRAMDLPPPLVPLLEAGLFHSLGRDLAVARGAVSLLYLAGALAIFFAGMQLAAAHGRQGTSDGTLIGAIAASLFLASPIAHGYATLVMLEIPGALLLCLALGLYLRYLRTGRCGDQVLACVASTALFFCKYNYGLLWLAPLALFEIGSAAGRMRAEGHRAAGVAWRELRVPLLLVVAPIVAWMLVPDRWPAMGEFLVNRDSGLGTWSGEALAFHPRAWLHDYAPSPGVGAITGGAALVSLAWGWRRSRQRRLLALAGVVGLVALTLHPYKLPRFLFPVAPVLWLAAAAALADALRWALRRVPRLDAETALASAAILVLAITGGRGVPSDRLLERHERRTVPARSEGALDGIADLAADEPGTAFVGVWNFLSRPLLEWRFASRHPGLYPENAPVVVWRDRTGSLEGDAARFLENARPGERLVVIELPREAPAWHPVYPIDTPGLDRIRAAVAADPRFDHEEDLYFAESGYRLHVHRRIGARAVGSAPD